MKDMVLVVENEGTQQILISKILKGQGFLPIVTDSLSEASSTVGAFDLQFAIIDIYLPEKNGWELIKGIRATEQTLGILIITGVLDKESKQFQQYYDDFKFNDIKIIS